MNPSKLHATGRDETHPSINMAIKNSYTTTPHHRQNRRRERPGSRIRRTISRKCNALYDCNEGCPDSRDVDPLLPSSKANPRPLLRQDFDQYWQRWKLRHAEEAQAEMDRLHLEQDRQRLFKIICLVLDKLLPDLDIVSSG
jgi:hypothetical protein